MSVLYLDASAFVKAVAVEPETNALRRFLRRSDARRVSSVILRVEAVRAVRHLGPRVLSRVRSGLRTLDLVGIDDRILEAAEAIDTSVIRTLDAIHLATALALGLDLDAIVTYDRRMADGAALMGLPVASPG